jgi:hypothetical protein
VGTGIPALLHAPSPLKSSERGGPSIPGLSLFRPAVLRYIHDGHQTTNRALIEADAVIGWKPH